MADRQSVIALVLSYVLDAKQSAAATLVPALVDSCVKTISAKSLWTWRERKKDDYAFTSSTATYELPDDCKTILYMGKLVNGIIETKYPCLPERLFVENYAALQGLTLVHYIPLKRDSITRTVSFRLFPLVSASVTGRLVYIAKADASDIEYIENTNLIKNCVLAEMPNEYLSGDSKVDVAGRFYSLYQNELASEISIDEQSRETIMFIEGSSRQAALTEFTDGI